MTSIKFSRAFCSLLKQPSICPETCVHCAGFRSDGKSLMIAKQLTIGLLGVFLVACSDPTIIIHESSEKSESSVTRNVCNFSAACELTPQVQIYLGSEQVQPETEFTIGLKSATKVEVVSAWLEGENMNMGRIPVFFDKNTLIAKTMVGVCTDKSMRWILHLALTVNGQSVTTSHPIAVNYQ